MSKVKERESVLEEWVEELPFTQQALLLLATRGADGMPKYNAAKQMVYYLRGVVLKAAYPDFYLMDGFMSKRIDESFDKSIDDFFRDTDTYPMHFLMHLIHAYEVVGYSHPDEQTRFWFYKFYSKACKAFHMNPETKEELNKRLSY